MQECSTLLSRRNICIGLGTSCLAALVPAASFGRGVDWFGIGEQIALECLRSPGIGAIFRVLQASRGPQAVRLHEDSLRQISEMMKQQFNERMLLDIHTTIKSLLGTLEDYQRAPEGLDRLHFATDHAKRLVNDCEALLENGPEDSYWLPGIASFGTAVSINIAILQERSHRFQSAGESCSIDNQRTAAYQVFDRWRRQRDELLRNLVTDPHQVLVGADGFSPGEWGKRVLTPRIWVWVCEVEGQTVRLNVECDFWSSSCTDADEKRRANSSVNMRREQMNRQRFGTTNAALVRYKRAWDALNVCPSALFVPPSTTSQTPVAPGGSTVIPPRSASTGPEVPATQRIPEPSYPARALAAGKTGHVILRFSIDSNGTIQDVVVVSSNPKGWGFETAAIEALRRGRYTPRIVNGVPLKTTDLRAEFEFKLTE